MKAQAKTINLLLYDGSLQGVISIEDSSWNSGEMYSAPRDSVEDLLVTDACRKYGVYLLLSDERVYIGQSSDLSRRLFQHINGKDWWKSAIILTTKDDSLNHADIDYLESTLIEKAQASGKLDCDNANRGNPRKVDKFRKVVLEQYLDEALFLMELIGITVFSNTRKNIPDGQSAPVPFAIDTMDARMRLKFGTRAKNDAIQFVRNNGFDPGKNVSYSTLQANKTEFWLNPQTGCLQDDWCIILNDNQSGKLIVLAVPACALQMAGSDRDGLRARSDKPELIDLHIELEGLVDRVSGIDFSPFLKREIEY